MPQFRMDIPQEQWDRLTEKAMKEKLSPTAFLTAMVQAHLISVIGDADVTKRERLKMKVEQMTPAERAALAIQLGV